MLTKGLVLARTENKFIPDMRYGKSIWSMGLGDDSSVQIWQIPAWTQDSAQKPAKEHTRHSSASPRSAALL